MRSAYSTHFKIGYGHVDRLGHVRPAALIQLLEEAAIENCDAIGRNVFDLLAEGYGWVLRGGSLKMLSYPRYRESVRVDTWISKWTPCQGVREFEVLTGRGEVCAVATSLWAYIDLGSRRPRPVPDVFRREWQFDERRAVDAEFIKRPLEIGDPCISAPLGVRRFDIDSNNHVHNVRYLEWVLETIPAEYFEARRLESVEGAFLREALPADEVVVAVGTLGPDALAHNVVRKADGIVLATGRSKWRTLERYSPSSSATSCMTP